ncbi:MAG: hypothetical protein EOO52_19425 [Gammaproteobacteria bacterium]|nr:MAG: hypothetical protein EOO52_19425 [Gammaproteobacteria bacterium]
MINEKDLETFLRAKKDAFAVKVLMSLSGVSLGILIFLEVTQVTNNYTILLATVSAVLMGSSAGANQWVSVSRAQLIETLENIIHSDPEALKLLATHRSGIETKSDITQETHTK